MSLSLFFFSLLVGPSLSGVVPAKPGTTFGTSSASQRAGSQGPALVDKVFTRKILEDSVDYSNFSGTPTSGNITVGIIGAGAAGLYSALLLESLGIDYEILEADSRPGGRILTHYFDEEAWARSSPGQPEYYDYVDLGAMRIPGMPYMDRIIGSGNNSIVSIVNSRVQSPDKLNLMPFIFDNNVGFRLFNDKLQRESAPAQGDPYDVGVSKAGVVPDNFALEDPHNVWESVVQEFLDALDKSYDAGFEKLMEFDSQSVREYFLSKNYTNTDVDWLETTGDATGHYDMALTETLIEEWIFKAAPIDSWVTVEGGLSRLIGGMVKSLPGLPKYSQRVTKIAPGSSEDLTVSIENSSKKYTFNHIINTAPLGAIQAMDLTALNLDYGKKLAIRRLNYDPAMKIGIKFKTRWWEQLPIPLKGGSSVSDLPIRQCVYPSYGINTPDAAAAMIASYTWGQDASRLGSYLATPQSQADLIHLTLQNLAAMNNVSYDFLSSQYADSVALSWYDSEFALGAFALFGPAQFSTNLPALLAPAADGRLHFAGEALSTGNGWIIGAVNSAYRAVAEILAREGMADRLLELQDKWGVIDEIDMGWYGDRRHTGSNPGDDGSGSQTEWTSR